MDICEFESNSNIVSYSAAYLFRILSYSIEAESLQIFFPCKNNSFELRITDSK